MPPSVCSWVASHFCVDGAFCPQDAVQLHSEFALLLPSSQVISSHLWLLMACVYWLNERGSPAPGSGTPRVQDGVVKPPCNLFLLPLKVWPRLIHVVAPKLACNGSQITRPAHFGVSKSDFCTQSEKSCLLKTFSMPESQSFCLHP